MIDIHSHILPGCDDGAESLEVSRDMLAAAARVGITHIVATPHLRRHFRYEQCQNAFEQLRPYALSMGVELRLGFEVNYVALLKLTERELPMARIEGTHALLLEFPTRLLPPEWQFTLSELIQCGYRIIIAHPERYAFIQNKPEIAREMINYGAMLQVDAESLDELPWSEYRRTALRILKAGQASFIASDAHNVKGYDRLEKLQKKYAALWPSGGFDLMM